MYLWKCWHNTRFLFIVLLILAAVVMPVDAVVCAGTSLLEKFGPQAFLSTFGFIAVAVALALGAQCASGEFEGNTTQFLFTKPRSRAYFVWAGWGVGCAQWLAIVLVNLLAGWATLSHYATHPFYPAVFGPIAPRQIASAFIFGVYVFCLTYSLTVILRSGLKGLGASMAIVFGVPFLAIAVHWRWKISLPVPTEPVGSLPPAVSNVFWIFVALAFILAAQLVVERTEI